MSRPVQGSDLDSASGGKPRTGGGRRPYIRPMAGWWRRDPFFVRYMVREATALAVWVYAVILMLGVLRLSQGEAAWNSWLDAHKTPGALALHGVLLLSMVVHAHSWFEIMPKTLPMITLGGRRLAASTIRRTGWGLTLLVSVLFFSLLRGWQS